jgi:hypothetical protein
MDIEIALCGDIGGITAGNILVYSVTDVITTR